MMPGWCGSGQRASSSLKGSPSRDFSEIWLPVGELLRTEDFGDVTSEVGGDGEIVYLCEALVDADVAEVAIEEAEADGNAVVDGVELGEALGWESFEAQRKVGVGGWRMMFCGTG